MFSLQQKIRDKGRTGGRGKEGGERGRGEK
jgi:hypothetical protein